MAFELDILIRELRHGALAAGLFVALVAPGPLGAQGSGAVTGTVTTAVPACSPLRVTFDQKVCGSELPDEAVARAPSGALANAVVSLVGVKATGTTAADGRFTLRGVPAGTYELRVWHEALKATPRNVTVTAGQTAVVDFDVK